MVCLCPIYPAYLPQCASNEHIISSLTCKCNCLTTFMIMFCALTKSGSLQIEILLSDRQASSLLRQICRLDSLLVLTSAAECLISTGKDTGKGRVYA